MYQTCNDRTEMLIVKCVGDITVKRNKITQLREVGSSVQFLMMFVLLQHPFSIND